MATGLLLLLTVTVVVASRLSSRSSVTVSRKTRSMVGVVGLGLVNVGSLAVSLSSVGTVNLAASRAAFDSAVNSHLYAIGSLSGRTFRDFYSGVATRVGSAAQGMGSDTDVQQAILDQADQRRSAVSGVSVDEEMVNLLEQQQAYGAAAKLVTAADDMIRTLLETM